MAATIRGNNGLSVGSGSAGEEEEPFWRYLRAYLKNRVDRI